jgi:DNA helicase HerA-like ATPase
VAVLREYEEQRDHTARNLLNRLSPLFELGLFPKQESRAASFETMLGERLVLALFDLPSKEIQSALAELIIIRLHGFLVRGDHPRKLTRLLVLDEAWRVAGSSHLESLAREGRAFGVGLAIGTQYPGDLPADLSGALATKIFLKNQQPDHKKSVVRALCGATSGAEAHKLFAHLENLAMFEGIIQNDQYAPYQTFKLVPYYARARAPLVEAAE